jgi:hypothetical protein
MVQDLDLKTALGKSTLDEAFKVMRLIHVKSGQQVELHLYSDGSGLFYHGNGEEKTFGNLPCLLYNLQQVEKLY